MKTKLLSVFVLAATLPVTGALAQTDAPAPSAPVAAPAPNQVIYSPRLPTAGELSNAAAAQGVTIEKIDQTASQITVIYKTSAGQTNTVAYQLLPAAGSAPAGNYPTVATPNSAAPVVVAPSSAPRVVYYEPDYGYAYGPSYYSPYWYPPVSFRLGLNYGFGGGFRGGFRGGFGGGFRRWR